MLDGGGSTERDILGMVKSRNEEDGQEEKAQRERKGRGEFMSYLHSPGARIMVSTLLTCI